MYKNNWLNAPIYYKIPETDDKNRSNQFRVLIGMIINNLGINNNEISDYLHSDEIILKRGVLYERIEGSWSASLEPSKRTIFIDVCKNALTLKSAGYNAFEYGGILSEPYPYTINDIMNWYSISSRAGMHVETAIIDSFLRIVANVHNQLSYNEKQKNMAACLTTDDAVRFVEVADSIQYSHRKYLQEFLYYSSQKFDGVSLVDHCILLRENCEINFQKELDESVRMRINEIDEKLDFDINVVSILVGLLMQYTLKYTFLKLYPIELQPQIDLLSSFATGIASYKLLKSYKQHNMDKLVYGGFSCPINNRGSRL